MLRSKNEIPVPSMENLPAGDIDWAEISGFIENMLSADNRCTKGWGIINDSTMTGNLKENSLTVLKTMYDELYGYFFVQHADRFETWNRMEQFVHAKYSKLSPKALSRIIAVYHIDDR